MYPLSTCSRARRLYSRILRDLEAASSAHGPAREAVLLRISDLVGELAEIAEGAEVTTDSPDNEGPTRDEVFFWLARISLELLRILGGAGCYTAWRRNKAYGSRRKPVLGSSAEADPTRIWSFAA